MLDIEFLERFEKRLGDEFLGDQVDRVAVFADLVGGAVADDRDPGPSEVARIPVSREKGIEKGLHAVRAGEDDPVIGAHIGQGLHEGGLLRWGFDADRRELVGVGSYPAELGKESAGLCTRAGDGDALAEEGAALEPVQGLAQVHHVAEDGDGGRLELHLGRERGNGFQGPDQRGMTPRGGPADKGDGCLPGHACVAELFGDGAEAFHTHQHHLGAGCRGDRLVIDARGLFARFLVAGEDRQHGVAGPVGHRNAGVGEAPDRRGDSRNDLEAEPCGGKRLGFLTAPAEEEGVAPLEAHHALSGGGVLHQQGVGLLLLEGVPPRGLARIDDFGACRHMPQEFGVGEVVVEDDLGLLEAIAAPERDESRVPGAGSDEMANAPGGGSGDAFCRVFSGDLLGHDKRSWSATSRAASSGEEAEAFAVRSTIGSASWSAT